MFFPINHEDYKVINDFLATLKREKDRHHFQHALAANIARAVLCVDERKT
ncbi:hypothetical protein QQ020_21925 [Fulvivirgaceae bacterium BMA12]|uniref:Uncharacterized protein n=1 Tax=Agaribacillus aureus TaxID=3051825 RepID=A0ABT8LAH4_9BACT|nr:hypothetical protein [Fulvivirgaceae bacterium BMA12]